MDHRHPLFWRRVHCVIGSWHRLCGTKQILPEELNEYMIPFVDCIPANYFCFAYPDSKPTSASTSSLNYEAHYDMARHVHSCKAISAGSPWWRPTTAIVPINGSVYDFADGRHCSITFVIERSSHAENPKIHFGPLLEIDCNGVRWFEDEHTGKWKHAWHPIVHEFDTETNTKSGPQILSHHGALYLISDFYNQLRCEIECKLYLGLPFDDGPQRETTFRCENVSTGVGFEISGVVRDYTFSVTIQEKTKIEIHPRKTETTHFWIKE